MQQTLDTLDFTGSEHWDPFNNIFLRARPCVGVQTDATCNIQQCWELCLIAQGLTFAQVYMYSSLSCLNKFLSFHFQQLLLDCKNRQKKYMYKCTCTVLLLLFIT